MFYSKLTKPPKVNQRSLKCFCMFYEKIVRKCLSEVHYSMNRINPTLGAVSSDPPIGVNPTHWWFILSHAGAELNNQVLYYTSWVDICTAGICLF